MLFSFKKNHTTRLSTARPTPPKRRAASMTSPKKDINISELVSKFYDNEAVYSRSLEACQNHYVTKLSVMDVAWKARCLFCFLDNDTKRLFLTALVLCRKTSCQIMWSSRSLPHSRRCLSKLLRFLQIWTAQCRLIITSPIRIFALFECRTCVAVHINYLLVLKIIHCVFVHTQKHKESGTAVNLGYIFVNHGPMFAVNLYME